MSYEGHEKVLCENGHLWVYYDYELYSLDLKTWRCKHCKSKAAWRTSVDETNGTEKNGLCPGDVKLRVRRSHYCKCPKCGKAHQSKPTEYHIPKRGRTLT